MDEWSQTGNTMKDLDTEFRRTPIQLVSLGTRPVLTHLVPETVLVPGPEGGVRRRGTTKVREAGRKGV